MRIATPGATLGAVVEGVDLAHLDDITWGRLHEAFLEHALLVFPGQHLDDAAQGAFARRFGPLEADLMGDRDTVLISNLDRDGGVRGADHPVMAILRGNEGWHTDSSYMPVSAKASVLSARRVPQRGGATEFADMRAAFDELSPALAADLASKAARHSLEYSQARAGESQQGGYGIGVDQVPVRSLVKVHPETGRSALFIGRHAHGVDGMSADESEALLDRLLADACREPRTLRHDWSAGDVVVWDNRCVLHRACPFDPTEARVMAHTRVAGDPVTEAALRLT